MCGKDILIGVHGEVFCLLLHHSSYLSLYERTLAKENCQSQHGCVLGVSPWETEREGCNYDIRVIKPPQEIT